MTDREGPAVVDAVLLDVNETLLTLDAVRSRMVDVGLPNDSLERWFAAILIDGFGAAVADTFVAFPDLARHHAARMLASRPGDAGDAVDRRDDVESILAGFGELEVQPDVCEALTVFGSAGVVTCTLTNGTAEVTDQALQRAGLREQVDHVWDVTDVGRWKPHAEAYRWACDRLGLAPERVALVAVHPWDVFGAQQAGLVGALVDRDARGATTPTGHAPDVIGPDLGAVARALTATTQP